MTKIAVRRINEWDAPSLLKIYAPYVTESLASPEAEVPMLAEYIRLIDRYTYGLGWIICEIDSVPVGFCKLSENRDDPENLFSVEIELYVKAEFRRMGIGRALYFLMTQIAQLGNRKELTARVILPNEEATYFHRAMGFKAMKTEKNAAEKFESTHDVQIFRKILLPQNSNAEKTIKPYLIESADYEAARECAAKLVHVNEN